MSTLHVDLTIDGLTGFDYRNSSGHPNREKHENKLGMQTWIMFPSPNKSMRRSLKKYVHVTLWLIVHFHRATVADYLAPAKPASGYKQQERYSVFELVFAPSLLHHHCGADVANLRHHRPLASHGDESTY